MRRINHYGCDEILRQDKVLQENVSAMRTMQSKTRMLVGECDDALLSQELSNLAENLQFSDPVSSEATQEMEYELSQLIDELQEALMEHEYESAGTLQRKAQDLLKERNRICKLNKHKLATMLNLERFVWRIRMQICNE